MAIKVLIVDDLPDAIVMLSDMLRHAGYDTLSATRGQQALALAEDIRPDMILLDVMMPGMDGIETCRRLRMNPATADIPVILVSARTPTEARAEGLLAGATDYVTKPVHFADLQERIERLIAPPTDLPSNHLRLLEEMVYTTLAVLPCDLAWLLAIDDDSHWLVHQAIAMEAGAEATVEFLDLVGMSQPGVHLPLVAGNNPLAEAVLNRRVIVDAQTDEFYRLTGGQDFSEVFEQFGFVYISLLPLVTSGETVGILVLATIDHVIADSERTQQILNSLSSQASMVVQNARLLSDLAAREAQMEAEQAFRQLVLDTMGEGLVVVDEEAKIIYVNNRLLLITGYNRDVLYGHSVGQIFHPDQRAQLVASLIDQRRSTQPFAQQLYTHDQRTIPVMLTRAVTPATNGRGRITVMVISDVSELHHHRDALQLQTQRLQALNRASTAISAASTFQDVVYASLEAAREVVHGSAAALFLAHGDHPRELYEVAAVGRRTKTSSSRRMLWGENLVGLVAEMSQSQLIADITHDATQSEHYTALYGPALRSLLIVPVIALDEVIGVLEVITTHTNAFTAQDLATLESLAGSAAIAIENARLFDQTRRRVTELSTLLDASAAVTTTLDVGSILEQIAHRLSVAIKVDRVMILDWDARSNHLAPLAEVVDCYWPPGTGPVTSPADRPLAHAAFERGTMIDAATATPPLMESNASGLYACAAFPISVAGEIVGVATLYRKSPQSSMLIENREAITGVIRQWATALVGTSGETGHNDWTARDALADLCQGILRAGGLRWCRVAYWDTDRAGFRLLHEVGRVLWVDQSSQLWHVEDYPKLGSALETGRAITLSLDDLAPDAQEQTYLRRVGGHTCLVAPLHIRGESSGLVVLVDSKPDRRSFDQAEISLCQGIANVVGNAMENAKLYTEQEQRASALASAYRQLQEADQIKDDLLQNLSHELRTPLTHLLGYLRLMQDNAFGPLNAEQTDVIDLVTHKAQQIADILEDIVVVQKPDSYHFSPRPIHLDRVVAVAVRSIAPQAAAQRIQIMPRVPANLPLAHADPDRMEDVFKELLDNAIKFSPPDSQIEIALDDPGGPMLRVCVRDYGIGIPADERERIFHRFYQVDSGTTRRFGGAGLGLAVVRQIVDGHNGRVWVESDPGQGSCFYVILPKANVMTQHEE